MEKEFKTHGVLDNKWTVLIEQKTLGRPVSVPTSQPTFTPKPVPVKSDIPMNV